MCPEVTKTFSQVSPRFLPGFLIDLSICKNIERKTYQKPTRKKRVVVCKMLLIPMKVYYASTRVLANLILVNFAGLLVITRHHEGVLTWYCDRLKATSLPELFKLAIIVTMAVYRYRDVPYALLRNHKNTGSPAWLNPWTVCFEKTKWKRMFPHVLT